MPSPSDPHRLGDVLRWIERLEHRARDPRAVRLAAWAAAVGGGGVWRAARFLPRVGVEPALLADVERLLGVLREHDPDDNDADGAVLCDAQLAVLGAPAMEYRTHVEGLRRASGLPEVAWRRRRLAEVRELLGRDSVYRTPEMRATAKAGPS